MSVFTITASDAWLTRLPERLAEELGYFKEADLQVEVRYPEPWNKVLEELDSGAAQCAADGIWLPSLYKKRVRDYYAFAQCAARFPMTLVARKPVDAFKWKDLEGKIVLVPGSNDAGMRMYFLGCAREGGADIGKIKYVPNFYAPMLYECFAGGWGDYVVMRSDLADQLIADGKGYPALDLTVNGGTVPWTVYYATADYLESSWEP
ncbi:MAG: ABC transporter substrate-binding protein, partial [Planctomycetes bacterium]|nr:ABC transporter substrate-binding protein [Planctomycetota bacterium]